jgi:hypothetical protein
LQLGFFRVLERGLIRISTVLAWHRSKWPFARHYRNKYKIKSRKNRLIIYFFSWTIVIHIFNLILFIMNDHNFIWLSSCTWCFVNWRWLSKVKGTT